MLRNPATDHVEKTQLFEIANLFEKNKSTKRQFRHLTVSCTVIAQPSSDENSHLDMNLDKHQ